jgi:Fe-Mn family superoxide dismutase
MSPTRLHALAASLCLLAALAVPTGVQATDAASPASGAKNFTLPPLPYDYAALEPYIDAETMRVSWTQGWWRA